MPLFVYRANAADHTHENLQFIEVCKLLKNRYSGSHDYCLYIPNFRLNGRNFDGLLIKANAIVVLEFKNYSNGRVQASDNATWMFYEKSGTYTKSSGIQGGAANNVTEQAEKNVKTALEHFNHKKRCDGGLKWGDDVHSLVCFNENIKIDNKLQGRTRKWLNICSIETFMETLDKIVSPNVSWSLDSIFAIIRQENLAEIDIMMDYTDVDDMPNDLYHSDYPHDGNIPQSPKRPQGISSEKAEEIIRENEELRKKISENNEYITEAKRLIEGVTELLRNSISQNQGNEELLEQQKLAIEQLKTKLEQLEEDNEILRKSLEENQKIAEQENISISEISSINSNRTPHRTGHRRRLKPFCVDWDKVNNDDEEMRAIKESMDKHLIVTGCAGSGKSIVALYKAKAIQEAGYSYCVIVFNKTLKDYMSAGFVDLKLNGKVYTRGEWDKLQRPKVDYIIVDEVQDFSIEEIRNIRLSANKYMFMFGDSNQSIYQSLKATTTIEELCKEFDIASPLILNNCYRLPKSVAPLLPYILKDIEYIEGRYKNENANTPYIIQAESYNEQLKMIHHDIIKKGNLKEVGILLPSNDMVLQVASELVVNGMEVEIRYRGEDVEKSKQFDTLNFNNTAPKLMTYHSAKGLQFETVIIPLCPSFRNISELKRLYVALTRTYRNLYILYSGDMPTPLNQIDSSLYKNSLSI